MLLFLALIAQPAPPAPQMPPPPVIRVAPTPRAKLSELTPAMRTKVEALDLKARAAINGWLAERTGVDEAWADALSADPLDPARVRKAAAAVDAIYRRGPVMANWAELLLSAGAADRKILAERLRHSGGRVFDYLPPASRQTPEQERAEQDRHDRAYKLMFEVEKTARDADVGRLDRAKQLSALNRRATELAMVRPFDATAVKSVYADIARLRAEDQRLRLGHIVDAFAALRDEDRRIMIDTIPGFFSFTALRAQ